MVREIKNVINKDDAIFMAIKLGVNFDNFSVDDWVAGLNYELEHGTINPQTNITNDDLEITAKIVLAHLYIYPQYYNRDYGIFAWEEFMAYKKMSNE